jgi:DNA-directed RNA polymerase specialized sigma24 family protein
MDALRRTKRARNVEKRTVSGMTSESQAPVSGMGTPDVSAGIEFWEAFGKLPLKQREALLLVFHYGLSPGEASSVLGIPAGTVRSRVYKARVRLAGLLEEGPRELPGEGECGR